MDKNFVSLHNHDTFSLLDGLSRPRKYLEIAKSYGMKSYAQTNHGTMAGVFEFVDTAVELGIKPIIGVEAYFVDDKSVKGIVVEELVKDKKTGEMVMEQRTRDTRKHLILLAKNLEGYKAILRAQYNAVKYGFYYRPRIDWTDLEYMKGNVVVSSACISGVIAEPVKKGKLDEAEVVAIRLKEMFGDDFYFEYQALERTNVYGPVWSQMLELARKLKIKSIITLDTHYPEKGMDDLQDIIHNVGSKAKMSDIKSGNAWVFDDRDLYLKDYNKVMEIMSKIFQPEHVAKMLQNTFEIDEKIQAYDIYPKGFIIPKTDFSEEKIKSLLNTNFKKLVPEQRIDVYQARLKFEYEVIQRLGFLEYMWIVQDVVNWAKSQEIMVGCGRGSAGGSLVAYLLNITDIDPVRFGLSFERFLNPNRRKMPDIDVDFQRSRRDEVIQYLVDKYGEDNVAHIANYTLMTPKQAFKDVLRIYDVPFAEANAATKYLEEFEKAPDEYQEYFNISNKLEDNVRQLSTHASGILMTDRPLYNYIPVNLITGTLSSGIDMEYLEKKQFLKLDILGLNSLDIIKLTLDYIKKYEGKVVDIVNIDIKDENVLKLYKDADTENIFQFETYNFRQLEKRAKPQNFKHLVELNALNRPVTLSLGMHEDYIKRKNDGEEWEATAILKKHLSKTYGLLLYQEQLISIIADILDISAGEADDIRRKVVVIGFVEATKKYKDKLYLKYPKEEVDETLETLNKVAGYSFNLCLTGDTFLWARFGAGKRKVTIDQLFRKKRKNTNAFKVLSYFENEGFDINEIKDVHDNGEQEVFEIELENSKKIKATENHRFYTNKGWMTVKDIMNDKFVEIAYMKKDCKGLHTGCKAWNKNLTKETNASLKHLSEKRMGNDHCLRKFGGKPHNADKKAETYEPLRRMAKTRTGQKMSSVACEHMSISALKRERKGNPGKRSAEACRHIGDATLRRIANGRYSKLYSRPHRLLHDKMVEVSLWSGFKNEVTIGYHSIDICNVLKKIAIQVDGDYYHANSEWMKLRKAKELNKMQLKNLANDKRCNTYLKNHSWTLLRFWASEIENNINEVIFKIKKVIDDAKII